jgi:hypothetical protein
MRFSLGRNTVLTLSEKFTVAGGGTYTPFDLQKSDQAGYGVLDSAHVFSARNPPYIRLDFNAELHINWKATSLTFYLSVINSLGITNPIDRYFYYQNGLPAIGEDDDLPFIPILGIRFDF